MVGKPSRASTISSLPSGTSAILSRAAFTLSFRYSRSRPSIAGWRTTLRPRPRATPSMVTSSCVGPTPPEVNTTSKREWESRTAAAIVSTSSGMVRMRSSVTPRLRSSRARKGELVSTTLPERISLPMMMMPAVRSTAARLLDRDRVLAEVAGADLHVHDARLARAEGPLEGRPEITGSLDPLPVPAERFDHQVVAGVGQSRRRRAVGAVHLHLAAEDLRPRRVVADDADDVDLLANAGLEF